MAFVTHVGGCVPATTVASIVAAERPAKIGSLGRACVHSPLSASQLRQLSSLRQPKGRTSRSERSRRLGGWQAGAIGGLRAGSRHGVRCEAAGAAPAQPTLDDAKRDVLGVLSTIIDPDFGTDIVSCGFIKALEVDQESGGVSFTLELTTPACPVKDQFERDARDKVAALPWVSSVAVRMTAQPARPIEADEVPPGLRRVSHIIAVSSCKGGVGKSTVAVNLAYALHGMGAKVGLFDADVYGPSLPTMVSPEMRVLQMDPETRAITPTEFEGVKLISFGFAGQGSAIMRGPMVSGVVNQLLTTTDWGELDYLVLDFPPGTGDIQLTLSQAVPINAAVIVTTPQKLSFIDVVKGIRMFAKLRVPCVAVVENMCYFDADGKRYFPFGQGAGEQVVQQFGIPALVQLPIRPELSASGDGGVPQVISDPSGEIAQRFYEVGASVVQECAKLRKQMNTAVRYDPDLKAIVVQVPGADEVFFLHPATVRRNDRSARSVDEWTGEQKLQYEDVPEDIEPECVRPVGNYAVAISWPDGLTQIAPYDQLEEMERVIDAMSAFEMQRVPSNGSSQVQDQMPHERKEQEQAPSGAPSVRQSAAAAILAHAEFLKAR